MRVRSRFVLILLFAMPLLVAGPLRAADLASIKKTIGAEPAYRTKPRYCLLVFGAEAKIRVWIVEDERTLYIDRNANGDLTDDGPPIQPSNVRGLGPGRLDYEYLLDEIKPLNGPTQTKFRLARWNYGDKEDSYGLSVILHDDKPASGSTKVKVDSPAANSTAGSQAAEAQATDDGIKMYAGWFGKFWADSTAEASIIHFGGLLEPRLIRNKEFIVDAGVRRLSVCLLTPGLGEAGPARLSEFAIPISTPIHVRIEWPVAAGSPPLVTSHKLGQHCCYWEYYSSEFSVPQNKGIIDGTANVTIELPDGEFPLPLRTNKTEVRVRLTEPIEPSSKK